MNFFIGTFEFLIFLYLANRTLKNTDNLIDNLIYLYLCQIFNYKLWGSIAWLNIGVSLYSVDCTVLLMILILVVKFKIYRKWYIGLSLLFAVMAIQSCVRGLMTFGMTSEFWGDVRKYIHFIIPVLYFSCVPIKTNLMILKAKLDKCFVVVTIYVVVVLAFFFIGMPLGERASNRPLLADFAIIYGAYIGLCWYCDLMLSDKPRMSWKTIIYTLILILNRFNTTWVALFVSLMVLLLIYIIGPYRKKLTKTFTVQIAIVICFAVLFFTSDNVVTKEVFRMAEKFDVSENNTYSGRMELWALLMDLVKGKEAVIGYPFGSGFRAYYRGSYWQYSPHNGYLETLLRTGYIGVVSLVALMLAIIAKAWQDRKILPIMMCVNSMVFWYAYSLTIEQGIIIGVCAQLVFFRRKQNDLELHNI